MKVAEAVENMTKSYLLKIIDSFTKDFPKPDEDRAREIIVQNVDELTDPDRISRRLAVRDRPYSEQVLHHLILASMLDQSDHSATEEEIIEHVSDTERSVIAEAEGSSSLSYEDPMAVDVFRAVLEVAVEDDQVSWEELRLVRRLRRRLGIQERSKHVILAQLNHYPRAGNAVHTPSEFRSALNDLQRLGVVFYCNRLDESCYVIPEELAEGVKKALGIELTSKPWRLLLENLTVSHLQDVLTSHGLPTSGKKDDKIDRIVHAGLKPSEVLGSLKNSDLYGILSALPGANVSGSKDERTQRIIDYFENLVIRDTENGAVHREAVYYTYFVELARRDRESLLANKVISKDKNMDLAFEQGARYLFEEKMGLESYPTPGSDHADGVIEFAKDGDIMMWDTKSKETTYRFPPTHVRQFKRYIRDSLRRVKCFLVIVPEIDAAAELMCHKLKSESQQDTDVALVAAEDLKWVAENWRKFARSDRFNLEVFNATGVLGRRTLEQRLKLFP